MRSWRRSSVSCWAERRRRKVSATACDSRLGELSPAPLPGQAPGERGAPGRAVPRLQRAVLHDDVAVARRGGLGTVGLPESKLKEPATQAGFADVRRVPRDTPFNNL